MADEDPRPPDRRAARIERALLLAIVAVAALLRFGGIDHDLRRTGAEFDEDHNFVDPIRRMWNKGTADPVVYSGYPGFFNYLAFVPVLVGQALGGDVGAVTAGRALVAAFGVLNVVLVHRVCRTPMGPGPALGAAALMALSRAEVRAAHYITPDVLVVSALLGILLMGRPPARPGDPLRLGALCGLASAVKYTGLLIAPGAVVVLLLTPRRASALARALAGGLVAFALAAPYAILALGRPGMGAGLADVVGVYFGVASADLVGNEAAQGRGLALGDVAGELLGSVGPGGVILAALAPLFRRHRTLVAAAASVAAANILVLALANLIYSRHVLVLAGAVVVLAAAGAAGLRERWPVGRSPVLAAGIALAVLLPPARLSVPLVISYARPGPADRVAEWIERSSTSGAIVATSYPRLDLDPARFEVRTFPSWTRIPPAALPHYDLLVLRSAAERAELPSAQVLASFHSDRWEASVARVPGPALTRITPDAIEASGAAERAPAAFDGNPATVWAAPAGPVSLTARWPEPRDVHRVEIEVGSPERSWPQTVTFEGWIDERGGRVPLRIFGVRPNHPSRQRASARPGQVFVLDPPVVLRGLRLVRPDGSAWDVAELKVMAR